MQLKPVIWKYYSWSELIIDKTYHNESHFYKINIRTFEFLKFNTEISKHLSGFMYEKKHWWMVISNKKLIVELWSFLEERCVEYTILQLQQKRK